MTLPRSNCAGPRRATLLTAGRRPRSPVARVALAFALLFPVAEVQGVCGLDEALWDQFRAVDGPELEKFRATSISCTACHLGPNGGPRNVYGNILNTLLDFRDRNDPARQREAGRRVTEIVSDPSSLSFTFGELIQKGHLPGVVAATEDAPSPTMIRGFELLTVDRARELVLQAESESPFGILQLSKVEEITTEVAEVLASFQGEFLILGIRSISPAVAEALARSRAANLWLHSLTTLPPRLAETLSDAQPMLVLTGLKRLDSVALAEKLASRPGALSFPYLEELSPGAAEVLVDREGSLTLAGLTRISPEVQDVLAASKGALYLPNLRSLDSLALTRKLAAGYPVLTQIETLTPEQAGIIAGVIGYPSFFLSLVLPLKAITPEVATALGNSRSGINLTLVGEGPIADETLEILLRSKVRLNLRDVEELSITQAKIVIEAADRNPAQPGVVSVAGISLPSVRVLDSALLAEIFNRGALPNVTQISPEAAAFLGALPEEEFLDAPDGELVVRPTGSLSLPRLADLSLECAQLLAARSWAGIKLPALAEASPEVLRTLAAASPSLTIGIRSLTPELAQAAAEGAARHAIANANLTFPLLEDLPPESAQAFVDVLNRGVNVNGQSRWSLTPRLQFGEIYGPFAGRFTLSPETASVLADYDGSLSLGLGELSDAAASPLAQFDGTILQIGGPALDRLAPAAAASLAQTPATLYLPLRELDSVPLAERFAWQYKRSFYDLEYISPEAIPALVKSNGLFDVRKIVVLDSPELARRFVNSSNFTGPTLPALSRISPEAAEIVATSPNGILLGLTAIDSPAVATALAGAQNEVSLPRLRAATPEVLAILAQAEGIKSPPLESLHILR